MDCPYFSILEYGAFDSNVKFPRMLTTQQRLLDCYELEFYAADTPGKTYLDGQWYPLLQGTFLCAKPGSIRKSILPFKCYYIHLQTENRTLAAILDQIPPIFSMVQSRQTQQLWSEMLSLEPSARPTDQLLLESCVLRLIHSIHHRWYVTSAVRSERTFLHQKALLSVEQYIRDHLAEPLTLETLAAMCNLSPNYFHTVFTDFFHKTPAQFILELRITAAKTGLLTGDYSLAELAADCGFSSQSYFCYKFKQITGESPMQYRKKNLGKLEL